MLRGSLLERVGDRPLVRRPALAEVLPVLSLVLPLAASRIVSDSLLRQRLALDRVSQAEVISSIVTLPLTVGCALAGLGVWALVVGSVANPAVRSVATFAFAPWCPGVRIGGSRVREVIHFSLATLGVKMMWALREWGNTLVIGKVTGQVDTVGLYFNGRRNRTVARHQNFHRRKFAELPRHGGAAN
jgi:O-antigen/teichoic acid export membrane protein